MDSHRASGYIVELTKMLFFTSKLMVETFAKGGILQMSHRIDQDISYGRHVSQI
jgi:hypothetical protein